MNRAAVEGGLDADLRQEFEVAFNILYVRTDTLQRIMQQNAIPEAGLLGCRLSLDDFGTGYSFFGISRADARRRAQARQELCRRSRNLRRVRGIVASVVEIARTLDLGVMVEGIETLAQARIAEDLGCTVGQGYFFGRPAPAERCVPPGIPHDQIVNTSATSLPRMHRQG